MVVRLYMDHHVPRAITDGDCIRDLEIIGKAGNPEDLMNIVLYLPL